MAKSKNMYKAAIIGCGRIASEFDDDPLMIKTYGIASHAGGYIDNPYIDLIAVADINIEKLEKCGKRWGVNKLYSNYKKLLKNERIDILSICTWNSTHLEIFEEVAKYGVRAVFCEKPISDSLKNADKILNIARKNNIVLFTNHSRRWDDLYQEIKGLINKGAFGEIQQVSCYYNAGIANTCSHLFDVLRMFFGEVKSVCAWYKDDSNKDDPNMDGYLTFCNKTTVTLQSLDIQHYALFEFDIYGTEGRIRIQDNGFKVCYWKARDSLKYQGCNELFEEKPPVEITEKKIIKNAIQNIVDSLSSNVLPACNGQDGVKSLEIICAFHLSAKGGNIPILLPLEQRDLLIKSK